MGAARVSVPSARPAWYALETGGWRDYVTLLHLPYTAWHLSYVVIGGCLAPVVAWERLGAAVSGELGAAALLAAAFAVLLSLAQRALSNHVRFVRRRVASVSGAIELPDGTRELLDADRLIAAEERGLRLLAAASVVLAAALVAFRL